MISFDLFEAFSQSFLFLTPFSNSWLDRKPSFKIPGKFELSDGIESDKNFIDSLLFFFSNEIAHNLST